MAKPKEPKTYFEQVPLEIVKKIAAEDIPDDGADEPAGRLILRQRNPPSSRGSNPSRRTAFDSHFSSGLKADRK